MKTERGKVMGKEKLRYTLFELNGHLVFSIFYMDERFRSHGDAIKFAASNGWRVCSIECPEIDLVGKTIYLLGKSSKDDRKIDLEKLSEEELNETEMIIDQIHLALREWAEEWEGWKEKQPKSRPSSNFPIFSC